MDHKSKNSHHGGTSIVELDGTLLELGVFVEFVPSEIEGSVAEVTNEFVSSSGDVLHDTEFKDTAEGNDLDPANGRNSIRSVDGGPSVRDVLEQETILVDGSTEVDTVTGGDLSQEGKHTDTSVLDLGVSKTVELFLVTIGHQVEGIVESKRRLGSENILEGVQGGAGGLLLGRSKGGGGGDKGGKDGGLHGVSVDV